MNDTTATILDKYITALRLATAMALVDWGAVNLAMHMALNDLDERNCAEIEALIADRELLRTQLNVANAALGAARASQNVGVMPVVTPLTPIALVTQIDDAAAFEIVADPMWPMVHEELQRLSTNGVGPSKTLWDSERDDGIPKSDEITAHFQVRWSKLLKAAGLLNPTAQHKFAAREEAGHVAERFPS